MREIGRQRRLRRLVTIGLAAMVAIAVGGSLAATQAKAASTKPAAAGPIRQQAVLRVTTVDPYTGKHDDRLPLHAPQQQGHEGPDPHLRRDHPGHLGAGQERPSADVVLGFKTLADYVKFNSPPVAPTTGVYFGETVGRYANRIAKGTFTLNQPGQGPVKYTLPVNNGPNALHGGIVGFGNHIWADQPVFRPGAVGVQLTLISPNGDESGAAGSPGCPNGCTGYPAAIKVVVTFTLNNANQLGHPLHDHQLVQEPQHGPQPDQPQLLQPGRRELVPRLGLRPVHPDQREQVHADRHHLDPARLPGVGVRHAVQLHYARSDGRPDPGRQRQLQFARASTSCWKPRVTTTTGC